MVKFQLSGKDPVPEIERLGSYFAQLTKDKVIIPDFMQALILAAALPKEWTAISTAMFQLYGTEKFTFEVISDSIIGEYRRSYAMKQQHYSREKANKISRVKRKEKDASWNGQRKDDNNQHQGSDESKERPHPRKGFRGKGKKRTQEADVPPESDQEHNAIEIISLALSIVAQNIQARVFPPAAQFTGQSQTHNGIWKQSNKTRTLAEHIGITPTMETLKILDTITKDDISFEPLPKYKRSIIDLDYSTVGNTEDVLEETLFYDSEKDYDIPMDPFDKPMDPLFDDDAVSLSDKLSHSFVNEETTKCFLQ